MIETLISVGLGMLMLLASALLTMAATALRRADLMFLRQRAEEGSRRAAFVVKIHDSPDRMAAARNGMLFLGFAAQVAWSGLFVYALFQHTSRIAALLGLFFVVILVGYAVGVSLPKTLALRAPGRVALHVVPFAAGIAASLPVRLFTSSAIKFTNTVVPGWSNAHGPFAFEQQYLELVSLRAPRDEIEHEEQKLLRSVIEVRDTIAREVMVPRTDIVSVGEDRLASEALNLAMAKGYSRLPVYSGETDRITGVVYLKDLVRNVRNDQVPESHVADLVKDPKFVPETKNVLELLREMQREKLHISMIVDEYGTIVGMATLEDLLEEVVGDINDEYDPDEVPAIEVLGKVEWRIDAGTSLDVIHRHLHVQLPGGEWDTVGGLIIDAFERVPDRGDEILLGEYAFVIESASDRRIKRLRMRHVGSEGIEKVAGE